MTTVTCSASTPCRPSSPLKGWLACALIVSGGASGAASASGDAGPGVQGVVTLSPSCGGAQREGGAPCEAPYAGAEVRLVSGNGATVAAARTTTAGHYLVSAATGHYRVMVTTPIRFTRCPSPEVVVTEGKVSVVDVECDSGMR